MLFLGNVFLSLLLTFIDGLSIFSLAPIVASIQAGGPTEEISSYLYAFFEKIGLPTTIETFLIVFVLLSIFRVCMRILIQCYIINSKIFVIRTVVIDFADKIMNASLNFINNQKQGDFINYMIMSNFSIRKYFI